MRWRPDRQSRTQSAAPPACAKQFYGKAGNTRVGSRVVVTGAGPLASARVQLQDPSELAANTGTNGGGNLTGDGIALELDLSTFTTSQRLR